MKRLSIVLAVLALALAAAPVALAGNANGPQHGNKAGWKIFTANGKVTAVDDVAGTLTMKVWSGSKLLRRQRGKEIVVKVTESTLIHRVVVKRLVKVSSLAEVKPGERIWVRGKITVVDSSRVYTATRVRLKATWPFSARGTITALDADADPDPAVVTLTVKLTRSMAALRALVGQEVVFTTRAATAFRKWVDGERTVITFSDLQVGDNVYLGGWVDNREPTDRQYILKRVTVK